MSMPCMPTVLHLKKQSQAVSHREHPCPLGPKGDSCVCKVPTGSARAHWAPKGSTRARWVAKGNTHVHWGPKGSICACQVSRWNKTKGPLVADAEGDAAESEAYSAADTHQDPKRITQVCWLPKERSCNGRSPNQDPVMTRTPKEAPVPTVSPQRASGHGESPQEADRQGSLQVVSEPIRSPKGVSVPGRLPQGAKLKIPEWLREQLLQIMPSLPLLLGSPQRASETNKIPQRAKLKISKHLRQQLL